jgi:iron-sulfur cluster assembly accessory protein
MSEMIAHQPAERAPALSLSAGAAARIRKILEKSPEARLLRVAVSGGGCSGFRYEFSLIAAAQEDDLVIERDGAAMAVDSASLTFLDGSGVDYVDEILGAHFTVRNPNATSGCGCGTSFSV